MVTVRSRVGWSQAGGHDAVSSYDGGVTDTSAGPASWARWRWAVTVAFGLGGITISAWGPRLPDIKADLGIGTGTIGLLLAGVTVGALLGLLGSTPLLHRLGGRRAILAALLLIAAAMTLLGVAEIYRIDRAADHG